jgi:hypothetical protein
MNGHYLQPQLWKYAGWILTLATLLPELPVVSLSGILEGDGATVNNVTHTYLNWFYLQLH